MFKKRSIRKKVDDEDEAGDAGDAPGILSGEPPSKVKVKSGTSTKSKSKGASMSNGRGVIERSTRTQHGARPTLGVDAHTDARTQITVAIRSHT
jgi:hypothetical protein